MCHKHRKLDGVSIASINFYFSFPSSAYNDDEEISENPELLCTYINPFFDVEE